MSSRQARKNKKDELKLSAAVRGRSWRRNIQIALRQLAKGANVLEIGASTHPLCFHDVWLPHLKYSALDLDESRIRSTLPDLPAENVIVGDLHCLDHVESDQFDAVISIDVLEHVCRPWECAKEIIRITKPGGIIFTVAPFSWRYHPCPLDYFRFSPAALESMFQDGTTTVVKGFDYGVRRDDKRGFWKSGKDRPPIDKLGGWRENVESFLFSRKNNA